MSTNTSTNSTMYPVTPGQFAAYGTYYAIFWLNYVLMMAALIGVMLANCVLRKYQPMRSRFWSPFITNLAQLFFLVVWIFLIQLPSVIQTPKPVPRPVTIVANALSGLRYIGMEVAVAAYSMHFLRFILLRIFTQMQRNAYKQAVATTRNAGDAVPQMSPSMRSKLRFFRIALSNRFYFIVVAFPIVVMLPITVILVALQESGAVRFRVRADDVLLGIMLVYFGVVIAAPAIIVSAIDFFGNIKMIFSPGGLRFFFMESEPLLFRVEALIIIPECIFGIVGGSLQFPDVFPSFAARWTVRYITQVMLALYNWCFVLRNGGIATIATLIQLQKQRSLRSKSSDDSESSQATDTASTSGGMSSRVTRTASMTGSMSEASKKTGRTKDLYEVLLDENGNTLFEAYCKSEFSLENLLCWRHIQNYKNATTAKDRRQFADFIWTNFVAMGSMMEVNISSDQRNGVKVVLFDAQLQKKVDAAAGQPPAAAGMLPAINALSSPGSPGTPAPATPMSPVTPMSPSDDSVLISNPAAESTEMTLTSEPSTPGRGDHKSSGAAPAEPEPSMLPEDMFGNVQRTIESNLLDTFSRFAQTQSYAHYKTNAKRYIELLKKSHFM